VILQVPLPQPLPPAGVQVKLRFRRVPPLSCVVRPILDGDSPIPLDVSYLYGRGEGSPAKEQAWINVRISPAVVAAHGARPATLKLVIESLDGKPIDDPDFLELIDRELHPL